MAILKLLTNNIPLTLACSWVIALPTIYLYRKYLDRIEKFPTTIRDDKQFQMFKDGLKRNNSKKGF